MPAGVAAESTLRPPLKWAGGKRWQVPHLRPLWKRHAHRRLVEPFCGGLAVALGLRPKTALLNDANPHLVNFYPGCSAVSRFDLPMENDEDQFYRHRERFNAILSAGAEDSAEAAAIFYYLNRTGFNGLCRFNRQGAFNVPFGHIRGLPTGGISRVIQTVFANWTFTTVDIEAVPFEPGDFVYADPPYDVEFTHYAKDGFSWADQERTAEQLARHKGPVVLVNQATSRVETLYRKLGYSIRFLKGPRRISCTGDRSPAREIVGTRNL